MKLKTDVVIDKLEYLNIEIDFSSVEEAISKIAANNIQQCFVEGDVGLYPGENVGELKLLFFVGAGGDINARCNLNFKELVADIIEVSSDEEQHHLAGAWARVFEDIAKTLKDHASHVDALYSEAKD